MRAFLLCYFDIFDFGELVVDTSVASEDLNASHV